MIPYGNHSAGSVALPAKLTSHSPKTRRSAVKARRYFSIRYANHSSGGVALPGLQSVAGAPGGRHAHRNPASREAMSCAGCAGGGYARTSLRAVARSNDAHRVRACGAVSVAAERHFALGELAGSPRTSGVKPRASHTAPWRRSRGRVQAMAGEPLRCSTGAIASTFANAVAASWARVTALHSAYRSCVERRTATPLQTLSRPRPKQ